MPESSENILEFHCPKCDKRLKAGASIAGRKVKCPKCATVVKVPGPVPSSSEISDDDWLALDVPAIGDLDERKASAEAIRSTKEQARRKSHSQSSSARSQPPQPAPRKNSPASPTQSVALSSRPVESKARSAESTKTGESQAINSAGSDAKSPTTGQSHVDDATGTSSTQFVGDEDADEFRLAPIAEKRKSQVAAAKKVGPNEEKPRSVFDDDLPELAELETPKPKSRSVESLLAAHLDSNELAEVFDGPASGPAASVQTVDDAEKDPEYKIVCKTCGTAQYVRLSQKGEEIKCPDCWDTIVVPPPRPGVLEKKKPWAPQPSLEPDVELAPPDASVVTDEAKQRSRAQGLLEKAKLELSDEEIEKLYDHDFDTQSFVNRTFGCFRDVIAVAQIVGYGIVFGLLFAVAAFAAGVSTTTMGKGLVLLVGIVGPLVGMLFALPMMSGGLALIESVANREKKLTEWPGFNLFDNMGDLFVIMGSLVAAMLPGFLLGGWIGSALAMGGLVQVTAIMVSTFSLFPIFLLSMLDNGSIFQPVSKSIIQSMTEAAEAWGGYFLKTLVAFGLITFLWYFLLGNNPITAGIGGFLLPILFFFVCQQIGALADSISEHLSFEFTPGSDESDDGDDAGSAREKI